MDAPIEKRIRALLVQEHEIPRRGMRLLLQADGGIDVAGETDSASEAMDKLLGLRPEVVLVAEKLPDSDAASLCRAIRSARPATRVLVLASGRNSDTLAQAASAGVTAVVPYTAAVQTLIRAVHAAAAGRALDMLELDPDLGRMSAPPRSHAKPAEGLQSLSAQERRVLREVAAGLTNKQVAVALNLSEKTVKNYLHNAFKKLKVTRRSQAVAHYIHHVVGQSAAASANEPK
ncbi:MAG: response regulator transcription factor [Rhodocyclaceae bacterium]|nr:response regulator transcription factor [Rhodocyclaceae bacterium]MBX3668146.1 response regulator transcription factor [Rhodocyclaceae bacterium]